MPNAAGLEQDILCVVQFSASMFDNGLMKETCAVPTNLYLCFGNPLGCEQKKGLVLQA